MCAAVTPRINSLTSAGQHTLSRTPPVMPTLSSPPRRKHEQRHNNGGVVIENSTLLGNFNDLADVLLFSQENENGPSAFTSTNFDSDNSGGCGSGHSARSRVIDFIDHCVVNGVPELFIVEHVMFMVRAMQEQISLNEALHARFHHDRLQQYEISELTNMLERQKLCNKQLQHPKENVGVKTDRMTMAPEQRGCDALLDSHRSVNIDDYTEAKSKKKGLSAQVERSAIRKPSVRVAFTQTPPDDCDKKSRLSGENSSYGALRFCGFMRPTEASNRKERRRCAVGTGVDPHTHVQQSKRSSDYLRRHNLLQQKSGTREKQIAHNSIIDKTIIAQRGRLRALGELGTSARGKRLTWSDDDVDSVTDHIYGYHRLYLPSSVQFDKNKTFKSRLDLHHKQQRQQQQQSDQLEQQETLSGLISPVRSQFLQQKSGAVSSSNQETAARICEKEKKTSAHASTSVVAPLDLRETHAVPALAVPAPPLSIQTQSFFPSQELLAYMEQSRRKVREAERMLANTPERSMNNRSIYMDSLSDSPSPFSGELSELSDE